MLLPNKHSRSVQTLTYLVDNRYPLDTSLDGTYYWLIRYKQICIQELNQSLEYSATLFLRNPILPSLAEPILQLAVKGLFSSSVLEPVLGWFRRACSHPPSQNQFSLDLKGPVFTSPEAKPVRWFASEGPVFTLLPKPIFWLAFQSLYSPYFSEPVSYLVTKGPVSASLCRTSSSCRAWTRTTPSPTGSSRRCSLGFCAHTGSARLSGLSLSCRCCPGSRYDLGRSL